MKFIKNNIEEILIFLGLLFITIATFLINPIAGIYVMGTILITIGIFLLKFPSERR